MPDRHLRDGVSSRRAHGEIYQSLRPNQVRTALQCFRLGASGASGKLFFSQHMSGDVLPYHAAPGVKFEADAQNPKAPAIVMDNILADILRSRVRKMEFEDDLSGADIAQKLTDEYGGELLYNALRMYRPLGDPIHRKASAPIGFPPSETTTTHTHPCKVGGIILPRPTILLLLREGFSPRRGRKG